MTQVFVFTLAVSALVSLLIAVVCLLRPFTQKAFDSKAQYDFWRQIAVIALAAPLALLLFGWGGNAAEQQLAQAPAKPLATHEVQLTSPQTDGTFGAAAISTADFPVPMPTASAKPYLRPLFGLLQHRALPALAWAWLLVGLLLLAGRITAYLRFRKMLAAGSQPFAWQEIPLPEAEIAQMRKSAPTLELRRLLNPAAWGAPFLIGLLNPCLYLPKADFSPADWRNMLLHELTHYKRRDIGSKWAMMFSKSLHWFNPAFYFAERQLEQECEISCDLTVVGNMNGELRRDYMRTILHMVGPAAGVAASGRLHTGMNDDKKRIKRRFELISGYKMKLGKSARRLSLLLIFLLVFAAGAGSVWAAKIIRENAPLALAGGESKVVVSNNGQVVNLQNQPIVTATGEIYLPLREMLEQFGVITANDGSLQYQDYQIQLNLQQWVPDAAGGRVLTTFYSRTINMSVSDIPTIQRNGVIYVPLSMLLEVGQMSAGSGGQAMQGLAIIQYDGLGGEVWRIISLPLREENPPQLLDERFAVLPQFAAAWQQGDYQTMQSLCCGEALEKVGWQYMDMMIGRAAAMTVWQPGNEPEAAVLQVLTKPMDGRSSFGNRQLDVEVSKQADGRWLISKLSSSQRELSNLSGLFGYTISYNGHMLQWPTESRLISNPFRQGGLPQNGDLPHNGIDIVDEAGKPVYAAADGKIIAAGYMGAEGNKIILSHFSERDEWETRYSHLSEIAVQVGDEVQAGQLIGYIGSTGSSTGPHLHFTALRNGQVIDPEPLLPQLKY